MIIGENNAVENTITTSYSGAYSVVLEIDPVVLSIVKFSDWDGYIAIEELSGNSIDYDIKSVVGDIEASEMTGTVSGNSSTIITLSKTVKYRLYIKSTDGTSTGQVKVAYRINYYRCG